MNAVLRSCFFVILVLHLNGSIATALDTPPDLTSVNRSKDSPVWHSFRSFVPEFEPSYPKNRSRRQPQSSSLTVDAYVNHAIIIKLDHALYLNALKLEKKLTNGKDADPIEFFPSLDGKPR